MSLLAATQIPKPADEQAFERASLVLWRGLLNDPSIQRNGRRGQRQNGVDLSGIRNGDADWHVGIQCKLKSEGHSLSEKEVREEVEKALTFKPTLKEYYIITTAPYDVAMQELAREITKELAAARNVMRVFVWGWNTLEERISEDAEARKAFDPTYTLFSEEILAETKAISAGQTAGFARMESMFAEIKSTLANPPGDSTIEANAVEAHLDAQIDEYRELNNSGKTLTVVPLLERLLTRVSTSASGRILFRIKANIGHCLLALGQDDDAAAMLLEAFKHAPGEPKAIANKAFGLLLQGRWDELLTFGMAQLKVDPANEWLAGYLVQAAKFDISVSDPLKLIPEKLHRTAAVQISLVDFVWRRGKPGEWREAARSALAMHPAETEIIRFAAEAEIDEILSNQSFQRKPVLSLPERRRLEAATATLMSMWNRARQADGPLRPEGRALCGNVVVGLASLDQFNSAVEVARQGLALAPDDHEILVRATMVAIEAGDDAFADELIPQLPSSTASLLLQFQYHAVRANWREVVALLEKNTSPIPKTEELMIATTVRLARIRTDIDDPEERRQQIAVVAAEAAGDPRASITVAEFAQREQMEKLADSAFASALELISDESYAVERLMVAHHANRRGDFAVVVDLLDGRVAEDHDGNDLRMLAQAFVNDMPIRQRALSFFARLPATVRELSYYLHAEGLLHFNRGALNEAEVALRKATDAEPDLKNYMALFSVLHRLDRSDDVKALIDGIDLTTVKGTPAQKMLLAQVMRKIGQGPKALKYAYEVLQSTRNDQKAVLRYFGLIMMDPDVDLIPTTAHVAADTWVRLESNRHERHAFLIEEGADRPADDVLSPTHPIAAATLGLRVGDEFELPVGFGENRRWRVAEIKHKYLHALHDVMENFENRFPDAKGFYTFTMQDGDIQPALEQVRRVAESNRNRADLYLKHNFPISFVTSMGERDSIRFVEYIRFLDFDIQTCLGTESERLAARGLIEVHQTAGLVLDAYAAWTVSTMDAFDVLKAVFGRLIIPQTVIDEIKTLRDEQDATPPGGMTIAWHNGQYIRQHHTRDEITRRRDYIVEQLNRISVACEVCPVVAPDDPTDLAILITQSIDRHVLDAANLAGEEHLLLSEDMYYRQLAKDACGAKGIWLQVIFSFALEKGVIDHRRYADLVIKLAWRRHGHLALTSETMLAVVRSDGEHSSENFKAVTNFIGTRNADLRSHINVSTEFLNQLWQDFGQFDLRCMRATSALLERLIRFRSDNWGLVLEFLKRGCAVPVQKFIDGWIAGHFLPASEVTAAKLRIEDVTRQLRAKEN